jgi:hypothetical protein
MTEAMTITASVTFTANTGAIHDVLGRFTERRENYLIFTGCVREKWLLCKNATRTPCTNIGWKVSKEGSYTRACSITAGWFVDEPVIAIFKRGTGNLRMNLAVAASVSGSLL